jgi:hypothetical protein
MSTRALASLPGAARRLCLSRRRGEICTRPVGHAGLHHRVGTGLLWGERDADPPGCPGSGEPGESAALLDDGFPGGLALCPVCFGFVALADGRLAAHDTWRGDDSVAEADRRRDWFNTHGW